LVPEADESCAARLRLEACRKDSRVGDVVSPIDEVWEAEHDTP